MKVRVISAIVAAAISIPLIILGGYFFAIGVCIIAALAYKEILDLRKSHGEYPMFVIFLGFIAMIMFILSNYADASIYKGITYQTITFVLLILLLPTIFYKNDKYSTKDAFYLIGATLLLGIVFNVFIVLRNRGLFLFLYLLIVPMVTDIFAMLGGKYFGKNKMCPNLSPHKTWEGSLCGLIGGVLVGLIFYSTLVGSFSLHAAFITILLSVVGQMGDLVMSKIKRENEIKDFSIFMPGHGGILDRLDSVIFVFLTYMFLLII